MSLDVSLIQTEKCPNCGHEIKGDQVCDALEREYVRIFSDDIKNN